MNANREYRGGDASSTCGEATEQAASKTLRHMTKRYSFVDKIIRKHVEVSSSSVI
jgi:hypothetical protein